MDLTLPNIFKANWENTSATHTLSYGIVEKMVGLAYPDKKLMLYELLSGGCANLNYKIQLKNEIQPLILRIYLRDQEAAFREKKLSDLLDTQLPVPAYYYIGELDEYRFAITEFMSGLPLRNLLLGDYSCDLGGVMYEVGKVLAKIAAYRFPQAGFFDKDLNVIPHSESDGCLSFAKNCLKHETVLLILNSVTISKINKILDNSSHLLPNEYEAHLVHADFDLANILVNKVDDDWKITAILDWEFSFSGSSLWDVANMLRYSHKMPPEFRIEFINGLSSNGVELPENWEATVDILNLSSLLDCLKRSDPNKCPNRCTDIRDLIERLAKSFNFFSETSKTK